MHVHQKGVTIVELIFVLLMASLLLSIAVRETSGLGNQRAVGNARDAVLMTPHRARAEAMRTGQPVYIWIRPDAGDVDVGTASDTVQSLRMSDYGVAMEGDTITLCYTSRGYALPGCTTIASTAELVFTRGGSSTGLMVLPLGQMWSQP